MAVSLRSKVEEHLTCSVCLEQYKDPKVFPCLHSYCHECIVKLAAKANSSTILCPECRLAVKISDPQTLSSLPSNFFVNNLLATMSLADDHKVKEIPCDSCDTEDRAENRCRECGIFLCHFCTEFHKRSRATKLHQLLSMEELKSAAGPHSIADRIRCAKHKEELIKLYCETCQVTICRDCTIVDHREHQYGFVGDVALKQKQNLQKNLDEVKQRKIRVLRGIADLQKFDEGLVDKKEATISQINSHFDDLATVMASRKMELVKKVEALTTSKRKKIHAQVAQLEMASASCESGIGFTEQAFKNGNDVQILSMQKYILESLENLKTVKDQTQPCVSGDIFFTVPMTVEDTRNGFAVDDDVVCPETSKASFNDQQKRLEVGKQASIAVICNNKLGRRVHYGEKVIEPTFTGVDVSDVTITDNNDGSQILNFIPRSKGMLKFEVTINGTPAPSCSLTKNSLWVMNNACGVGTITNDGLTMSAAGFGAQYCYRIGGCSFESGVHTWKVKLSCQGQFRYHDVKADVGVVECGEIVPTSKQSVNEDHEKCVHVCHLQGYESLNIVLTLDMDNKTLKVLEILEGDQYLRVNQLNPINRRRGRMRIVEQENYCEVYKFTALRVCPFFGSSSPVSISIIE